MTITEFLLARIVEDEYDARAAWDGPFTLERMLAECAAKRAIIREHEITLINGTGWGCKADSFRMDRCRTLRTLAAIYADHPDYLPEWAL